MQRRLQWTLILAITFLAVVTAGQAQRGGPQRGAGQPGGQRGGPQRGPGAGPVPTPSPGTPGRGPGDNGRGQPRPPISMTNGGSIQGVVLRADTSETLSRARIDLVRADWAPSAPIRQMDPRTGITARQTVVTAPPMLTTNTDENGRFVFNNVEPGRYTLRAARNQFVRLDFGQRGRNELGAAIVVERGMRTEGIVLRLFLAPTLSGRVADALGQPLTAASVAAYRLVYGPSGRSFELAKATLSDDRGEYRLFWLSPGDYYLVAGYGEQVSKPLAEGVELTPNLPPQDQTYTVVYFPGVTRPADAELIRLSAGLDSFRDISFKDVTLHRIRGRVVDASTNRGVAGAEVLLLMGGGHTGAQEPEPIPTDANGVFTIPAVAAGTYVLYATAEPAQQPIGGNRTVTGPRLYSEIRRINLSEDVDNIILALGPPIQIDGRIQFQGILADRDGPTDAVRAMTGWDGRSVNLVRRDGGVDYPEGAVVRPEGGFTILDAPPGQYEVSAPVPSGFYIKSMRYSGRDVLASGLTIRSIDKSPGVLDIVLGPGAALDGQILQGGEPVPGVQIVLVPDPRWDTPRSPDRFKIAATDTTGAFYIRGVAPGRYLAFAFEELEARFYFDPEFLTRFGGRGVPIQVEENSLARPELRLITAAETEAWSR